MLELKPKQIHTKTGIKIFIVHKVQHFNWCSTTTTIRCTQPQLYVVRGGGRKGLHKPWGINFSLWIIATCAGGATPLTIPERITDSKRVSNRPSSFKGSITEVVISNKTRKSWCWINVWIYARTLITYIRL